MDSKHSIAGVAAALPIPNLDTDQIMPKQFLRGIDKSGLDRGVLHDLRFDGDGKARRDFVLNRAEYAGCRILVGGENFGCGSSREHAPWALENYGFHVLIAPSFADIFYNNCFKNGMLPIVLRDAEIQHLFEEVEAAPGYRLHIDLDTQTLTAAGGRIIGFKVDPFRRHCLLNGLDDIALTLAREADIRRYQASRRTLEPWIFDAS